jgi:hypothetical protein
MLPIVAPADHDTSKWGTPEHLDDEFSTNILDEMSMTKLKKDYEIVNKSQRLKVDFYNLFTRTAVKITKPGKLVRITSMVLCWIPQANNLKGKATLTLIDNRKGKSDPRRIESQITFHPGKPVIGIMYHNFAMSVNDLKYMDIEFITHGINMERGSMGRLSFGYKTHVGGPSFYKEKCPEVFYLPVEELPELSVESPKDIYNNFVAKMKKKKDAEIEYFSNLKQYIDMARTPINTLTADADKAISELKNDLEIMRKYQKDAKDYNLKRKEFLELERAIKETEERIEIYKSSDQNEESKQISYPSEPAKPIGPSVVFEGL